MLSVIEKVIFLQSVDVFEEVHTEELAYLATIAEEAAYIAGDVIYREEEPADALYLVLSGKVRLHRDDHEITIAGQNDAFGTWALFDEAPTVATATAIEDSRLLKINREDFYDILSDHVRITQGIFKTLAGRLRTLVYKVTTDQDKDAK